MPNLTWGVSSRRMIALVLGAVLYPLSTSAQFDDQHSIEAIVAALTTPIPQRMVKEARDFDDELMATGQQAGENVYLVTDGRSIRANAMVAKLLDAMGEDPSHWVVRVLDSNPPVTNAFVTGGKYIYVYTGLIDEAASDDELAFALSHELGHSLLKHRVRAEEDVTSTIANLAILAAILSNSNKEDYLDFAKFARSNYSRIDEEEADAIAVAITRRAGFDPLRGVDFFSRGERQRDKVRHDNEQTLHTMRQEVLEAQSACQKLMQQYSSARAFQTQENANKVNSICQFAEERRLNYNKTIQQYDIAKQQNTVDTFFSGHPPAQNRIAAIAALTDYLHTRRDLQSLSKYQQSYRVMRALQRVDSALLKAPTASAVTVDEASATLRASPSLTEQLSQLERAREKGLITGAEYEKKRQQILDRY